MGFFLHQEIFRKIKNQRLCKIDSNTTPIWSARWSPSGDEKMYYTSGEEESIDAKFVKTCLRKNLLACRISTVVILKKSPKSYRRASVFFTGLVICKLIRLTAYLIVNDSLFRAQGFPCSPFSSSTYSGDTARFFATPNRNITTSGPVSEPLPT